MALLDGLQEHRGRCALAESLAEGGETLALTERLLTRGREFSREEFVALTTVAPLIRHELLAQWARLMNITTQCQRSLGAPRYFRPRDRDLARSWWNAFWFLGNALPLIVYDGAAGLETELQMLASKPPGEVALALVMFSKNERVLAFRALWSLARLGKAVLPNLKQSYRDWSTETEWLAAFTCLVTLAVRNAPLRAEIRKTVESRGGIPARLHGLLQALSGPARDHCFDALYDPEAGTDFYLHLAQVHAWQILHPDEEQVPPRAELDRLIHCELAAELGINRPGPLCDQAITLVDLLIPLSWLGTLPAERLFLPGALLTDREGYRDDLALVQLARVRAGHPYDPVRREAPKVGRNASCPCGSGAKFKRCCGAGGDASH
jgi:hypothetical protein